jgi:signal transduction histidine kinase/CheY-like chemotaxis protein
VKPIERPEVSRCADILIVDDTDTQLKLLTSLLTKAGYQVRPASAGGLALRSIEARLPDLILIDVRMPGMDGYELCRQLKGEERTRAIPVIFISASVDSQERFKGFEAGAIDFITKPYYEAEVLARVATHITLNQARQELERKNAQLVAEARERTTLEHEVAHLASFPTQNPYPVVEVGTDGVVRFANAAAVTSLVRLGLEADARQFLPGTPEELDLLRSQCEQNPQTQELRLGRSTFLRTVSASGEDALRVYATDVTERSRITSELATTHDALLEAQAIGHIGDWSIDFATLTFVWSDELYVIHGIQPGTPMFHDTYLEVIHPEDRQHVLEVMRSGMAGKQQEFVVDYRIVQPDESERFISLTGKTLADSSGTVVSIRGTMQDITERKRAEAEKEAMQAQTLQAKKLEAVGQLAGGVAHNFNNLLTGILGNIDIARSEIDSRHPAASSLDAARTAALRAASLARKLLAAGRSTVLAPSAQNATVAVQEALDLVCPSIPDSSEIVRNLCPDAWDIMVDSSQLAQVLIELMNNAQEAMSDVGTITVRTRNVSVDDAYVATAPFARTGDFIVISVADTGPGIPPDMLSRLFEPFATTKQFGRGMGLPAVFGTIKQARGWIDVASEPGIGASFDLYLPRHVEVRSPSA